MPELFSKNGYALVLSGGAIRGFAHLGALKAIYDKKIPVKMIAGSSAGAIAGFLYASGNFQKAYDEISNFSLRDFISLIDLERPSKGLIKGDKMIKKISLMAGKSRIEDLNIPLIVSTTNFWDGNNISFDEGDIGKVLKASFAIPGIFPVVTHDEYTLMDGDLSNSLPVEYALGKKIICIDVKSSPLEFRKTNAYEALMKSFELLSNRNLKNRLSLARKRNAIIIQPKLKNIDYISFNHMKDAIKIGYDDTIKALEKAGL